MIARSGMEAAKVVLLRDLTSATEGGFDAPNQEWATNQTLFVDHPLGEGVLNVRVTDEESKLPVNKLTPVQWRRLLDLLDVEPADADVIADSVADWIDENDLHQLHGAEDDYYASLVPPYRAKNAPIDRVEELLLVRGVTPEIFYGQPATDDEEAIPGLVEFLTATSNGRININTASPLALKAALGLDDLQTEAVVQYRAGSDGEWGTDDDKPFRSLEEFYAVIGNLTDEVRAQLGEWLTVQSDHFSIRSSGDVGGVKRTVHAVVRRGSDNKIKIVLWREVRGG
jgi:general secretion pathway protein K